MGGVCIIPADAAHVWVTVVAAAAQATGSPGQNGRLTADHIHHIPAASHGCPKQNVVDVGGDAARAILNVLVIIHPFAGKERGIGLTACGLPLNFSASRLRRANAPRKIRASARFTLRTPSVSSSYSSSYFRRQPTYHTPGTAAGEGQYISKPAA